MEMVVSREKEEKMGLEGERDELKIGREKRLRIPSCVVLY